MGYKSDVRIRLKTEDYKNLVKEYEKKFPEDNEMFWEYLNVFIKQENVPCYELDDNKNISVINHNCVFFGWNNLKWYPEFAEVDFIMSFIQHCEHYAFCRVSESCEGDIEHKANNMDYIEVSYKFDEEKE